MNFHLDQEGNKLSHDVLPNHGIWKEKPPDDQTRIWLDETYPTWKTYWRFMESQMDWAFGRGSDWFDELNE